MRHGIGYRKLNKTSEHRKALFKNMLNSLIKYEQIITTLPKAKELKPQIDKVITIGKKNVLSNIKKLFSKLQNKKSVNDVGGESYANLTLGDYNATGYAGEYFKDKAYPQILMYMPQDIQDSFSAKWEGKKFGQIVTGGLAAAGQTGNINKLKT